MKLAFCLFKYFVHGGLQSDFLAIAKKCQSKGHEVHVYTRSWQGEIPKGFHIHLFPCRLSFTNISKDNHYITSVTSNLISRKDIDLVIGFNKMPGLDIYFAADSCYAEKISSKSSFAHNTSRHHKRLQWEKSLFSELSKTSILVITEQQQKEFLHHYKEAKKERIFFLPPGINEKFKAYCKNDTDKENITNTLSIPNNSNIVLMVGSAFKTKGVDRSLLAMANLDSSLQKNTYLIIAGKGKEKKFLQQAKRLGILPKIRFIGTYSNVEKLYAAATILLHPSYTESAGKVLLEATAMGVPILTTGNCGYAPYIKKAQNGIVLEMPFSQEKLNNALQEMLLAKDSLVEWGNQGRTFAQKEDLYSQHDQAVSIIENHKNKDSK